LLVGNCKNPIISLIQQKAGHRGTPDAHCCQGAER
jgi:hypothetical protein